MTIKTNREKVPTPPNWDADRFIERLAEGDLAPRDVCRVLGMPTWSWVRDEMRRDAVLADRINEALEKMPRDKQPPTRREPGATTDLSGIEISHDARAEGIKILRGLGFSSTVIGRVFNITRGRVQQIRKEYRIK